MPRVTTIGKLLKVLSFYKWAFGDLTESDSDVGILAEFLVGDLLGCLPPTRKEKAPFDLKTKSGVTIEVKATTHRQEWKGKASYYRWSVRTQSEAMKGNRTIADVWVFLIATFPRPTSCTSSVARAFDLKNWSCYLVSGEQLRTAGCMRNVSEATLRRLGLEPFPLGELKKRFNHEIHESA